MCGPEKIQTPKVSNAAPAAEETATSFKRQSSKEDFGSSFTDLQVKRTSISKYTGLQA